MATALASPTSFVNTCGRCGKTVYAAEKVVAAGKQWHQWCFNCVDCGKHLDSRTMSERDGEIYCATCYGRKFAIGGYGYGVGAGTLNTDKSEDNQMVNGHANGISSSPSSESPSIQQPDNALLFPKSPLQKLGQGTEKCGRCGKTVYAAEKAPGAGQPWHRACFNCVNCGKSLDSTNATVHSGEFYCKPCYGRKFTISGYGYSIGAGTLSTDKERPSTDSAQNEVYELHYENRKYYDGTEVGVEVVQEYEEYRPRPATRKTTSDRSAEEERVIVSEQKSEDGPQGMSLSDRMAIFAERVNATQKCGRCGKPVYAAEKNVAAGNAWHPHCFTCCNCGKRLDAGTLDVKDGEIFCKTCYSRKFAIKGYGYGIGAGTLSLGDSNNVQAVNSENYTEEHHHHHHHVENESAERRSVEDDVRSDSTAESLHRPISHRFDPAKQACGRCGKPVYVAEMNAAAGKVWHNYCFLCQNCGRRLDASTLAERSGDIFCKSCYAKKYAIRGYGYGMGAGTLMSEAVSGGDVVKSSTEREIPDYTRSNILHEPTETTTTNETEVIEERYETTVEYESQQAERTEAQESMEHLERATEDLSVTADGPVTLGQCAKCGKDVFADNSVVTVGQVYHPICFNCASCGKQLNPMDFQQRNGEKFCPDCFGEQFGDQGENRYGLLF